jgi:ribosomal protein S18 acetylase RimI-like enzyme
MRAADVGAIRPPPRASGVMIRPPGDLAELVAAYGGWMDDIALARRLVVEDDLRHPRRGFLVAEAGHRVVGCALVWWAEGTAYVSGLGVLAEQRGRGYGTALTIAAARMGAAGPAQAGPADVVWMYGTPEGAALYAALGFEAAGEEVQLGPVDGP